MNTYELKKPLRRLGTRYKVGESIELPDDVAEHLAARGYLAMPDAQPDASKQKRGKRKPTKPEPAPPPAAPEPQESAAPETPPTIAADAV